MTETHRFAGLVALALSLSACARGVQVDATQTVVQEAVTDNQIFGNSLPAKTVVLTYDDGPDEHTLEIAQYYADQGIHLTFFENGRRYCKQFDANGVCMTPMDTRACDDGQTQAPVTMPKYYPESIIDKLLALGHRVANHTQDHCHLQMETNTTDIGWELQTTQDIIEKHICDNVFLFRAPYGEWDAATSKRIKATPGLDKLVGPVNWDIDGEDWSCWQNKVSPEDCAAKYLSMLNARPNKNGIFLMHDRPEFNVGYEGPLLMAKIIVPKLKADGFKFATMDDVLKLTPNPKGSGCAVAAADAGAPDAAGSGGTSGDDAGGSGSGGASGSGGGGAAATGGASGSAGSAGAAGSSGDAGSSGSGAGGTSGSAGASGNGAGASGDGSGGSRGGDSTGSGGSSSSGHGTGGSRGTTSSGSGTSTGCTYGGRASDAGAPALLALAGVGLWITRRRRR